jgi:hypothetical protein
MLIITNEEKVALSVVGKTQAGNLAPITGVPVWSVSDEGVATISQSEDGLTATVVSVSAGVTLATVTLGELSAALEITVNEALVASIEIVAGTPELK